MPDIPVLDDHSAAWDQCATPVIHQEFPVVITSSTPLVKRNRDEAIVMNVSVKIHL